MAWVRSVAGMVKKYEQMYSKTSTREYTTASTCTVIKGEQNCPFLGRKLGNGSSELLQIFFVCFRHII